MNRIVLIVVFSMFAPFFLSAQQQQTRTSSTQNPSSYKPTANAASEEEFTPADVEKAVKELVDKLKKEKGSDPVPVSLLMSYAKDFIRLSKSPSIEKDTKISISWYKNVSESIFKLAEINGAIRTATLNKHEKQLEELKKIYKESVTKIIYLLEHPLKISEKK